VKDTAQIKNDPSSTAADTESNTLEGSDQPLTIEEVQAKPWKYIGYPTFSKWMASDADFFVLRRFDDLNVRVILHMQCELLGRECAKSLICQTDLMLDRSKYSAVLMLFMQIRNRSHG
jgi:hypothetical protein